MGPTNVALVKLFRADQELRQAQDRYDNAARSVRVQERRIAELTEKHKLALSQLREQQARAAEFDLEVKARDERIERLRTQQQGAKNLKEYQAFLTEINTEKIDRSKLEDEEIKAMEAVEKMQAEVKQLADQIAAEQVRLDQTRQQVSGKLSELQAEVERLRPLRDQAAAQVPAKARDAYERLADRHEEQPMSAVSRPDRRREEYVCTACNMDLVADMYNRLHLRDEVMFCPNCRRLLYIPDDLPPDAAINAKPKREKKEKPGRAEPAEAPAAEPASPQPASAENQPAPDAPEGQP